MNRNQKTWNEGQKKLRSALTQTDDLPSVLELFLQQQGMVHSKQISQEDLWSYEDELFDGLKREHL